MNTFCYKAWTMTRRRLWMIAIVAGLALPTHAIAQDGEEAPAQESAEGDETIVDGEADGAEERAAPKAAPAEEASGDAPAEESAPSAGAEGEDAQAKEGSGEESEDTGPKIGPGGRELRTDYPGTEESKRERMETDRIQGVASGEVSSKEVYDLRVRELETRIDDLKDEVFRSKSRIVLLKETLLGNKLAGSKALIVHKDESGRRFKLKRLTYLLDGNPIRNEIDRDGNLSDKETIELFNGAIGPGTHNLVVQLEYQGNAAVFNYFEGYSFDRQKSCKFIVEEGMVTIVDVVVYREGGVNTAVEESLKVRCDTSKTQVGTKDRTDE